ncbi:M14 family metallopeptidase [Cellulophaga sp. Hel_I_12]|uniref:M14 family metallopeptidase n=1 Tax=Cellulophaga sp. Hel_I_12 TaxID=1249972 RepID=UPI001E440AEE|nr:M14 family metallopeptidase [Cellulophaga sp. Hel_I_12]
MYTIDKLGVHASNDFDGARLNGFEQKNDSTVIVKIIPENTPINNSPYYAFSTWSNEPKPVYYTFEYPEGYKHRYFPKLKVDGHWTIIDSSAVFENDTIVTIKLNVTKSPIIVAAQEIQSSTHVKEWYINLANENKSTIKIGSVGKSKLNRNLPVLDIGIGEPKNKEIIVLLTRQHPPEVTGYFAFQEFLKTVTNKSDLSTAFLEKYRVIAFPIMNPDGVDLGHWRHNAGGIDLNRDWSKYHQPEIKNAVTFITKELKQNNSKLILGLDFHSTWYDVFYTNEIREETSLPDFISNWFKKLEENITNYKVNEQSANSTKPVSKGWFLMAHSAVGITYEMGDATPKETIQEIGKAAAEQMMNLLLINN